MGLRWWLRIRVKASSNGLQIFCSEFFGEGITQPVVSISCMTRPAWACVFANCSTSNTWDGRQSSRSRASSRRPKIASARLASSARGS